MTASPGEWIVAVVLATLIAGMAFRLGALSISGLIAAIALGTTVVGNGGWWPGIILVTFFATSSAFSGIRRASTLPQNQASRRNWMQVLANGWGMLIGSILFAISGWEPWLLFGFGSIAAATADTWSSEIGPRSSSYPHLITSGRSVPPGTSGAISTLGLVASFAGAVLIAGLASLASLAFWFGIRGEIINVFYVFPGIITAGVVGGLVDSLLGATVQEERRCEACDERTEANPHSCGETTVHIAGVRGFNNDVVNFICVSTGGLIGLVSGIL